MITIADWNKIKAEYIAGGISQRKLAAKYHISFNTLKKRANLEKWATARDTAYNRGTSKAQQATAERAATTAARIAEARDLAVVRVCEMIAEAKGSGNNMLALVTALEKLQKMSEPEGTAALKSARELLEGIDSVID